LQQCIDTAQVHNKNLQMSRNNMAIGEQREKEAKANLIPKVTANADYKYFTNLPYQLLPVKHLILHYLKENIRQCSLGFRTTSMQLTIVNAFV
jgi:hypothetical protein